MTRIRETELAEMCEGIAVDADSIVRHNPIGSRQEILLWMLLSCLISYLNLNEAETPCFPGKPTANIYREAILFILNPRKTGDFDPTEYIDKLAKA